jgi:hypothetical protein
MQFIDKGLNCRITWNTWLHLSCLGQKAAMTGEKGKTPSEIINIQLEDFRVSRMQFIDKGLNCRITWNTRLRLSCLGQKAAMTGEKGKTPSESDGIELEGLRVGSSLPAHFTLYSSSFRWCTSILLGHFAGLTTYSKSAADLRQLISLFSRSVLLNICVYEFLRWFCCWSDWEMAIQRLFVMSSTVTYNDRAVATCIVKWYRKIRYWWSSDVMAPFENWTVAFPPTVLLN